MDFETIKAIGQQAIGHKALTSENRGEEEYIRIQYPRYLEIWRTVAELANLWPPKPNILEIGTLHGHIAVGLHLMGYKVTTTDIQEEAEKHQPRLEKCGISEYVCDLNSEKLPFAENVFEIVVFTEVFEHLNPLALGKAISEISRVLKPGGYMVLTTPNFYNLGSRLRMILGLRVLCPEHIREYSLPEVKAVINGENLFLQSHLHPRIQLRIVRSWYSRATDGIHGGPWNIQLARRVLLPFKIIYPRFRTNFFVLARKQLEI